ncbi:Phosphatidylinositol 4-kinase PIK1 [Pseudozyma hubeiensis]|nr:Phosphatidylinositol 4-kinase PIK1 [Pseudozyma hubeiensis]
MASLLLRLFHSDYFSPHLALSYLRTYSDNIGITYYLVSQLESAFPSHQVEFYWPQLCHLLITKPSESRALECFILRRCSQSVHVALLTLWYFQAALSDLSANPHTASFQICHRVFNQCQRILFEDPLSNANSVYALGAAAATVQNDAGPSNSNLLHSGLQGLLVAATALGRQKVSPQAPLANIVGIGSVMASVPAMPQLASITGSIAIEQARQPPDAMQDALAARDFDSDADHEDDKAYTNSEDQAAAEDDEVVDSSDNDSLDEKVTAPSAPQPQPSQYGLSSFAGSLVKMAASSVSMSRAETAPPLPPPKDTPTSAPPAKPRAPSTSSNTAEVTSGGSLPAADASKKVDKPFATFAAGFNAGFNDFKGKAAAAVGEVFGQGQDVHGQSTNASAAIRKKNAAATTSPAPWSPQKHRQLASFNQQAAPSRSVPNLVSTKASISSAFASSATLDQSAAKTEAILTLYNAQARRSLLRSNYCKVQTQFLLSLQDISARLLLLPKPARLSALRAELTALNHKLPADVCFPLWCTADSTDTSQREPAKALRHHRVIRINPSEAVVLNSADRVPFLLHVEVLNNDLDFDPDRRQNRETLRRLVTEEDVRRRKVAASSGRSSFVQSAHEHSRTISEQDADTPTPTPDVSAIHGASALDSEDLSQVTRTSTPKPASQPLTPTIEHAEGDIAAAAGGLQQSPLKDSDVPPETGEEIDLTEQMYGSDLAGFGGERDGSSDDEQEEDLASRNRMHDTAAWTSAPSGASSAAVGSGVAGKDADGDVDQLAAGHRPMKEFSLDEYAQRMRTAAIMLSQLNKSTNASKAQAIVNYGPNVSSNAQGGWSSWIVPTNWYGSSTSGVAANGGGVGDKSEVGQGSAGVTTHVRTSIDPTRAAVGLPMGGGGGAGQSSRLVHAETEAIRKRIMEEMMSLEEERMRRMKAGGRNVTASRARARKAGQMGEDEEEAVLRAVNKDDPSAAMFSESWASKKQRIRASSPYGHLANWDVFSVIVKTGADLRQEQLAVQLINEFGRIWQETGSRCWVRYFRILVTSENSGLMETITDAVSVHSIKKEAYSRMSEEDKAASGGFSLYDHFLAAYGPSTSAAFGKARDKFMESLAGYSIISYLLQIKDRHNGNILVDNEGRLIHIDFGFMLGISPGGVGFEAAPFKMPQEYIDILGGLEGDKFDEFKGLMRQGFRDVRKHAERIIMLVELMAKDSRLPCFALGDLTAGNLRDRFQLGLSATQCDEFVDRLILSSAGSAFTRLYDMYQRLTEGVL